MKSIPKSETKKKEEVLNGYDKIEEDDEGPLNTKPNLNIET